MVTEMSYENLLISNSPDLSLIYNKDFLSHTSLKMSHTSSLYVNTYNDFSLSNPLFKQIQVIKSAFCVFHLTNIRQYVQL